MIAVRIAAGRPVAVDNRDGVTRYGVSGWHVYVPNQLNTMGVQVAGDEIHLWSSSDGRAQPGTTSSVRLTPRAVVLTRSVSSGVPLLYRRASDDLVVASDAAGLRLLGADPVPDSSALPEHLAFGILSNGRSYLRDVSAVPIGDSVSWQWSPGSLGPAVLAPAGDACAPQPDTEQSLAGVLDQAIASWRDTDHALLLSGGLDSSLLFRLLYRGGEPRETFSTDYWFYPGTGPELAYAMSAARELGARHRFVRATRGAFLRAMVDATVAAQVPLPSLPAALMHQLLTTIGEEGRGFVINGQGADAFFGGPPSWDDDWSARETSTGEWHEAWAVACRGMGIHRPDPFADRRQVLVRADRLARVPADRWRYYNQRVYLERGQAAWVASARAAGVGLVFPFLQPEVVRWATTRLPVDYVTAHKPALQELGRALGLSASLIQRPKLSFGPVGTAWLSEFTEAAHVVSDILPADALERVLAARGGHYVLWNLLTYAVWRQAVIERRSPEEVKAALMWSRSSSPRH